MTFESAWTKDSLTKLLVERFQIKTGFREGQYEIIERLVQGKRVLAIQRTGWGKSLCYQMASLCYPYLTIVFSPLKALMRDQYLHCSENYAIPAGIVSSDFTDDVNTTVLLKAIDNQIKILFIAPERLVNIDWQKHVIHMRINMVVIDEAHCISMWGHDFRPDYRRIQNLLKALPVNTPILALTATANRRVEEDILLQVGEDIEVIRGTMKRPNLRLNVVVLNGDDEKLSYLATLFPQLAGTGIIYTATKKAAEMVAAFLQQQGINAEYYHAGRENEERQEIERKLQNNQYKVICSTNALGMGIDKPDLRFVIHYQIAASPIDYYQEIGRAGRDGEASYCLLLYDKEDIKIREQLANNAKPKSEHYNMVLHVIQRSLLAGGLREKDILLETSVPSQIKVRIILADLQEQKLIEKKQERYIPLPQLKKLNFTDDTILEHKIEELQGIIKYASSEVCYMNYLTNYLGDTENHPCGTCGCCAAATFPPIVPSESTKQTATQFLEEDFLPVIEEKGAQHMKHKAGYSLAYYGNSGIGKLVRSSKYENGGPFADELAQSAAKMISKRYPLDTIDGLVSIPPTKSGKLVEVFARQVANMLSIPYISTLIKGRETRVQKDFVNKTQKEQNVKDAFIVSAPQLIVGRTLLLIDDVYDSGHTLRAATKALMQAGASAIYPFTITKTMHTDDQ